MRKEKLNLDHQGLLFESLKGVKTSISEYSFANLYLFREKHGYEVLFDEEIFIRGRTYDGIDYLMPTRDVRDIDPGYLKSLLGDHGAFFPIPEEWLGHFGPGEFVSNNSEGDTDYIYTLEKMATYGGRKLHKKRNLLKQFMELYSYEALPLVESRMGDAETILRAWQEGTGASPEETDFHPCMEALKLYERLILCGGIYYVEKEPAAFLIGEEINGEMFAIHFAKANTKFKGIYQFMYNNCAKVLPDKYKFLNFEQDLGKEELRIAKSSYVPDSLVKKYRVSLKQG